MPHVKGIKRDGFICVDDNVSFRGTVLGGGGMRPYNALDYFVDGTDGRDDIHSGKSWDGAFKTIQKAITTQGTDTNGKGDIIWIAPGTYAESLTGDLASVQVIGTGITPYDVKITPTATYAYTGAMTRAAFRNLKFVSSSSANPTYPAVLITSNMLYSVIDNCHFTGGHTSCNVGLHFGAVTAHTGWEQIEFSRITNNMFAADGSHQFHTGINFFGSNAATGHATKIIKSSVIANNSILVKSYGIRYCLGAYGCRGSITRGNTITSTETNYGVDQYGIKSEAATEDQQMFIIENFVHTTLSGRAIYNFGSQFTMGNYVAYSAGDPDTLYPAEA